VDLARYLVDALRAKGFEVVDPALSIVCFRWPGGDDAAQDTLQRALEESGEGWVSTTVLRGRTFLRAGVVNYLSASRRRRPRRRGPSRASRRRSHDGSRSHDGTLALSDLADQLRATAAAALTPVEGEVAVGGLTAPSRCCATPGACPTSARPRSRTCGSRRAS